MRSDKVMTESKSRKKDKIIRKVEDFDDLTQDYADEKPILEEVSEAIFQVEKKSVTCQAGGEKYQDLTVLLAKTLESNLMLMAEKSLDFLHKAKNFIDHSDWEKLIRQNRKLFVNFVLGQYLSAENCLFQMLWLNTDESEAEMQSLVFQDIEELLSNRLSLFSNDVGMQNAYMAYADSLAKLNIKPQFKEEIAEIIAFYPGSLSLKRRPEIERHLKKLIGDFFLKSGLSLDMDELYRTCHTLESMVKIFEKSNLCREGLLATFAPRPLGPNDNQLDLCYTYEEGLWLVQMRDKIMSKTFSMHHYPDIMADIINYTFFHKPLSPTYGQRSYRLFWDRLWSIYCSYPEFVMLAESDKARVVLNSHRTVYAIICLMMDGLPMEQQQRFIFTDSDREDNAFLKQLSGLTAMSGQGSQGQPRLRSMRLRDVHPEIPQEWGKKNDRVRALVRTSMEEDLSVYIYLMVSAMFDAIPEEAYRESRWKGFASLRRVHMLNLARRFGSESQSLINHALFEFRILGTALPF